MKIGFLAPLLTATAICTTAVQADEPPRVVVDIAPVHSLVAQVMEGAGDPSLLLGTSASPHDYSMKPSEARMLSQAELVVWTGAVMTPWLAETIENLSPDAQQVEFSEVSGVTLLPVRTGARFEEHDHESHAHDEDHHDDGHHEPAHHEDDHHDEAHHDEDHHDHDDGGHNDGHDHGDQAYDGHLWLDPQNAAVLIAHVADVLSDIDRDHAALYAANARRALAGLAELEDRIDTTLAPVRSKPFLVFHDAYHYFEARFDVHARGAISVSDAQRPGAKRMREVQALIGDTGVACAFAEPQFDKSALQRFVADYDIATGVLDPLGSNLTPGPDHYGATLTQMADALAGCLGDDPT